MHGMAYHPEAPPLPHHLNLRLLRHTHQLAHQKYRELLDRYHI